MINNILLWCTSEVVGGCGLRGGCGINKGFSSPLMWPSLEYFSVDSGRGAELIEKGLPLEEEVDRNCNENNLMLTTT